MVLHIFDPLAPFHVVMIRFFDMFDLWHVKSMCFKKQIIPQMLFLIRSVFFYFSYIISNCAENWRIINIVHVVYLRNMGLSPARSNQRRSFGDLMSDIENEEDKIGQLPKRRSPYLSRGIKQVVKLQNPSVFHKFFHHCTKLINIVDLIVNAVFCRICTS